MSLWLEYRPDRIAFTDSRSLNFPGSARMLYSDEANVVALELPYKTESQIRRRFTFDADGKYHWPIKRIEYAMLIDLPEGKETVRFFHPLTAGAEVYLAKNDQGNFFIGNRDGRRMFTKDRTVNDVTEGRIPSNRAVWQFHGYKHAH